jgi:hypothetical protein
MTTDARSGDMSGFALRVACAGGHERGAQRLEQRRRGREDELR